MVHRARLPNDLPPTSSVLRVCLPRPSLNEMLAELSDDGSDLEDLGDDMGMDPEGFKAMMAEAQAAEAGAAADAAAATDDMARMREAAGMGGGMPDLDSMPDLDMDAEMAKMMQDMSFEEMEELLKEGGVDMGDEAVSVEELLGRGPRLSGREMQELADIMKDLTPDKLESDPAYVLWCGIVVPSVPTRATHPEPTWFFPISPGSLACVRALRLRQRVIELTGATADDFPDVPDEELVAAGLVSKDRRDE